MSGAKYPQFCALARATEIVGERWTLLIVRELMIGPARFSDLQERLAGVSPTVLTQRLNGLVSSGVAVKATLPRPARAPVYKLTAVGEGLRPTIHALIRWGGNFLFPIRRDDEFEPDWLVLALQAIARTGPVPQTQIVLEVSYKEKSVRVLVSGGENGTTVSAGDAPGAPVIRAPFDVMLKLAVGALTAKQASAAGLAKIEGSQASAERLKELFQRGAKH